MQLGMIGLGRMGGNMVRRLLAGGHQCVVFDTNPNTVAALVAAGATAAQDLADLATQLVAPRTVWCMVPAGEPTEALIACLTGVLAAGDIIVDGGNSYFKDDVRRSIALASHGLLYVDVGTSGGVWGAERGYCLMIGGPQEAYRQIEPLFRTLAPDATSARRTAGREGALSTAEAGYLYCGPSGAGHFVKMIHNGIEYGLMQAYAEGLDILKHAASESLPEKLRYHLDLKEITELWRRGSVIGSWLLDLTAMALLEDPNLSNYSGYIHDSGEGRWTVQAAVEEAVPADVLTAALYHRFRSRQEHTFAEQVISAMREKFGGHTENR